MLITREEIEKLAKDGPTVHQFPVAAWGGKIVSLRELDGLESLEWDMAQMDRHKDPGVSSRSGTGAEHLVQLCLIDPATKKQMFVPSDRTGIIRNFGGALQELYQRCTNINRFRLVDSEDTEKKSSDTPSSDSSATSLTE